MADATLLPPNATALERAAATACMPATELPVPLRELWNADTCPVPLLPWLAWAWGVESWNTQMSEGQQRAAIASSLQVKRHKGTAGAMRRAIAALGSEVRMQEWHAQVPQAEPYTYRLHVDVRQSGVDLGQLREFMRVARSTANLRSHLSDVALTVTSEAPLHWAAATCTGHEISVGYGATPAYADGTPAWDLMTDAAFNGDASTLAAIEHLHEVLSTISL